MTGNPDQSDGHWTRHATLTVSEAAQVLRISRNSAYTGVRNGAIPSLRIGHRVLVPTAGLAELLGRAPTTNK
jgi:excisionase family DNA binding protein